jgi:ATP-dependent DNA helicase RecQ
MMVDDFEPSARQDFDQSLFDELRQTRRRLADEKGVPPYMIFGDKTLQEMARVYPQTKERMAGIFGVGKEKLAKYGEIFLQAVRAYAEPRGYLEMMVAAVPSQKRSLHIKKEVTDTVMQSVQLFQEKKNLEAVAEARQLKVGTILQHLEEALTHGIRVDVSCLVFSSQARFDVIASAFKQSRGYSLTPVRERLGDAYSWDELKLARLLMRARDLSTVPSQVDQPF